MTPFSQSTGLKCVLALAIATIVLSGTTRTQAQSFNVVYPFTGGTDGGWPFAGLVIDKNGNLYGTASIGGNPACAPYGCGTVFEITSSGTYSVLYSFAGGNDGWNPESKLIMDAKGNLYGTTYNGGTGSSCTGGCGTAFKINTSGNESVLYSFKGGTDGANPQSALFVHGDILYGTTYDGGAHGYGTVFELSTTGREKAIYSFTGGADGANPVADVTFDTAGRLYGTASLGGDLTCVNADGVDGCGTVFQLVPPQQNPQKNPWTENVLYTFTGQTDGQTPWAGLTWGRSGNLYGAAAAGGQGGPNGGGTVFELTPSSGSWAFTVLYSLAGWGISGAYRDLLLDASGNLWGTTHCDGADGDGSVFELSPPISGNTWTYTDLYDFTGSTDGMFLHSNVVFDKLGNLYGTAMIAGQYGFGTVFKVTP